MTGGPTRQQRSRDEINAVEVGDNSYENGYGVGFSASGEEQMHRRVVEVSF